MCKTFCKWLFFLLLLSLDQLNHSELDGDKNSTLGKISTFNILKTRSTNITPKAKFFRGAFSFPRGFESRRNVDLVFSLFPSIDASNLKVRLLFSSGIELVDKVLDEGGSYLSEIGSVRANTRTEQRFTVNIVEGKPRFIQAFVDGEVYFGGELHKITEIASIDGDSDVSLQSVDTETSLPHKNKSLNNPEANARMNAVRKDENEEPWVSISEKANLSNPNGTITIEGYFKYLDQFSNEKSVRNARVELVDSDFLGDEHIAWGNTDLNGRFFFDKDDKGNPIDNNDGIGQGKRDIFVKVFCENTNVVSISNSIVAGALGISYWSSTDVTSEISDGYHYIGKWVMNDRDKRGSWGIYDAVLDEYNWFKQKANWSRPKIGIYWPVSDWPHFQPFIFGSNWIDIPRGWEWDRPTILHEYGHAIMYSAYGNSMPSTSHGGESHFIFSEKDGGFALNEGWAEFIECAVDNNPSNVNDVGQDLETNDWYNYTDRDDFDGAIIEGSVASILWDIFDSRSGDDDGLSLGFNHTSGSIWYIILNNRPNDINQFWTYWFQRYSYNQQLWSIYYKYGINKDNTSPSNPTSVTSSTHNTSTWSNNRLISMNWSGATDDLSGVSGYSWNFNQLSSSLPDAIQDGTGNSTSSSSLFDGNNYYFHLRTKDNAGNWNNSAVHRGPFWIDGTAPSNPSSFTSSSHSINVWSSNRNVAVSWSGANDGSGSGVAGYSWEWVSSQSTNAPDFTVDETNTSTISQSLSDGGTWYFHLRTKDITENWNNNNALYGPFKIDGNAPISGTISINNTALTTTSLIVTLNNLSASDGNGSGVSQMRFSNNGSGPWSQWETYSSTRPNWNLSSNGGSTDFGQKWVYVQYRDAIGNVSSSFQDDINYSSTQTKTLTIGSWSPGSGVLITVNPNDKNGQGNGTTQFTRTYDNNTVVTLVALANAGGNDFQRWQRNGENWLTNRTATVTMDADYTLIAVYSTTTKTLTIASSNPSSGVSITVSPNDNNGLGSSTTPFTRTYNNNSSVTLTASTTASGNNFQKWQQNGADYSSNQGIIITMNADYTMTAVYATGPPSCFTLTTFVNPSGGGEISINTAQNCSGGYTSGTKINLSATAKANYIFSDWETSGGGTFSNTTSPTTEFTITGNAAVTADFVATGSITTLATGLSNPSDLVVDLTSAYWVDVGSRSIKKVSTSGGTVTTLASDLFSPSGIALDDNFVYFGEYAGDGNSNIKKVPKVGGAISTLASELPSVAKVALGGTNVYWTDIYEGSVKKVSTNGGSVITIATGSNFPFGIAVDNVNVYWSEFINPGTIKKVPLNGGNVIKLANNSNAPGVATDGVNVYWAESVFSNAGRVSKMTMEGGNITTLAGSLNYAWNIAIDGTNVYWVESTSNGFVKQVPISGGLSIVLANGLSEPYAIAVDNSNVYWIERNNGQAGAGTLKKVAKNTTPTSPLTFTDISASLVGVQMSSSAWGDYDNDGDLDILIIGQTNPNSVSRATKLYRNDDRNFTDVNTALPFVQSGSIAWGDYDNDGDLDILLTGATENSFIAAIYRNDNGNFVLVNTPLAQVFSGTGVWGDYDNDGDLDILLTGRNITGEVVSKIYRNDGNGVFVDIGASLIGVYSRGSAAWGDYDNDGDLDILLTGLTSSESDITKIYQNDNGNFFDVSTTVVGIEQGIAVWGDYDSDGDLDILVVGRPGSGFASKIYKNDNGNFVDIGASLMPITQGTAAWGDYDNDGDLDVLITGSASGNTGNVTKIYRNDNGIFVDISAVILGAANSSVSWGDYDNDGDLDIFLSGFEDGSRPYISRIYRNNTTTLNIVPTVPMNLKSTVAGNSVTLSWDKATDNQTAQNGLTYNLRVGKTPSGCEIMSPMSAINGFHKVPNMGNTFHKDSRVIKNLSPGTYYWSVQAIDNTFAGSQFATEQTFTVTNSQAAFYVNNLTGSDNNSGSPNTPKKTIQAAVNAAVSGNTIVVATTGQMYNESFTISGKTLTLNSSGGTPEISNVTINLSGLSSNQLMFTGPFKIQALDLTEGTVQVSNTTLSISDNGTIIRRSQSAGFSSLMTGSLNHGNNVSVVYAPSSPIDIETGIELPSTVKDLTITRSANIPNSKVTIKTNVTVDGTLTIRNNLNSNANTSVSILGDVIISLDVSNSNATLPICFFGSEIQFIGANNQTLIVPSNGASVGSFIINKTNPSNTITLSGGNLTCTGIVTFINGLLLTGANSLVLANPVNSTEHGFVHNIAVGKKSHVVGSVRKTLKVGQSQGFGRNEFPIGDINNYRPAAYTFVNQSLSAGISLGVDVIVGHTNARPRGIVGLPIKNGIGPGIDILGYPNFYWSVSSTQNMGQTSFDLELTASGFTDFDNISNIRIIRRFGSQTDITNAWTLQGSNYDNFVIGGVPTVVAMNSSTGFRTEGAIFTYGMNYTISSVFEQLNEKAPKEFTLEQNFPNPFNPRTTIRFGLSKDAYVTLVIYNVLGTQIRKLINNELVHSGVHQIKWDGTDENGRELNSGIYFYRIIEGNFTETRKMLLLK